MPGSSFQAVLLAGGEDKALFPLTSGIVKALLPVANRPLLSYPLRSLSDAGLTHVLVVSDLEHHLNARCMYFLLLEKCFMTPKHA